MWEQDVMFGFDFLFFILRKQRCIFAEMILWLEDTPSKEEYDSKFRAIFDT